MTCQPSAVEVAVLVLFGIFAGLSFCLALPTIYEIAYEIKHGWPPQSDPYRKEHQGRRGRA